MMTTRPKGTSLVMTMMMMTNIVGQAEYTNLVMMMMMSLRRTNNVGQARRHQPSENDDDDNGHGARRQSLVPSFSISHYSSQNSLHKVIQPNEPYSLAMPLLIDTLVFEINP